jgi:hypothetical protein
MALSPVQPVRLCSKPRTYTRNATVVNTSEIFLKQEEIFLNLSARKDIPDFVNTVKR